MRRTLSGVLAVGLCEEFTADEARDLLDRRLAREAGGLAMSSAAALPRDRGHVEALLRGAKAHPARRAVLRRRLPDESGQLGALDRAQVVDDPFGIGLLGPRGVEVGLLEVRDDDAAAVEDLGVLERPGDELQLGERDVLVDALEDAVDVGASLDELGGQAESLRRRV